MRIDTLVDLRVHAIPSVAAYLDLGPAASGMTVTSESPAGSGATAGPTRRRPRAAVVVDVDRAPGRPRPLVDLSGDDQAIGEAGDDVATALALTLLAVSIALFG